MLTFIALLHRILVFIARIRVPDVNVIVKGT